MIIFPLFRYEKKRSVKTGILFLFLHHSFVSHPLLQFLSFLSFVQHFVQSSVSWLLELSSRWRFFKQKKPEEWPQKGSRAPPGGRVIYFTRGWCRSQMTRVHDYFLSLRAPGSSENHLILVNSTFLNHKIRITSTFFSEFVSRIEKKELELELWFCWPELLGQHQHKEGIWWLLVKLKLIL